MTFREKLRGLIEDHNIQTVKPGVYDPELLIDQIKSLILTEVIGEDVSDEDSNHMDPEEIFGRNITKDDQRLIVEGN